MPGPQDPKGVQSVTTPRPVKAPAGTPAQGGIGGMFGTVPQWSRWTVTLNDGTTRTYEGPTPPDPVTGNAPDAVLRGSDVDTDVQTAWQKAQGAQGEGKIVTGPDGRKYRVTGDQMVPLEGQGAGVDPTAPKPGTVASQQNADTSAARQQSTQDYQEGLLLARSRQLDAQQRLQEGQQKVQQLDALLKIQAITPAEYTSRLAAWKNGVDAGDAARRTAIEQQNAQTSAGQLGVSRGTLGVNQQNADTQREQVIQSASSNAVDQTLKLYQQYAKVGPGFGAQFAAGLNTLSRGGGALNFTPDAFMGAPVPDINQIRSQAVTEAIERLKGGAGQMAPATAAAVSQTAVPGPVAPSVLPPQPGPPPVQPGMSPEELAAKAAALFGQQPAQAAAAPPVPPYTGPTGSIGERNLPY